MPALGNALDFAKYEARNIRAHQLGTAPASPVTGQLYYNTGDNTLYWWNGTIWVSASGGTLGPASGDITGTYPALQIAAGVIVDADVNAANKDGTAATPSMRTLGTGANQAAAGNDARFTDARAPTAHAITHQPGGTDPMAVDAAAATGSLRTIGSGATQALAGNTRLDQVIAPTAPVSLNSQKITNLATPTAATDGANKGYVDGVVQGLEAKQSVRVASTANVTLTAPGAAIDGITLANGDRVLLKNQTAPAENGLYIFNGSAATMTRATDGDAWTELVSAYVWVEQGTANADSGWVCTVDQGGTLGTTAITWVQFSGAGQITSGAGLTKTGNTLDVGAGTGITVAADTVGLTVPVALANGGTGQTTQKTARETGMAASGYYSSATHGAGTTIAITQATHLLRASRGLLVQVQDEATGAVEYPDVVVAANGDVTITYGASVTANSKRVTVVG